MFLRDEKTSRMTLQLLIILEGCVHLGAAAASSFSRATHLESIRSVWAQSSTGPETRYALRNTRNPIPETRTPKPETRNTCARAGHAAMGKLLLDKGATIDAKDTCRPRTRHPNPESSIPKPKTRNPETESRIPNPGTRNPTPESRIPEPETRHPKPDFRVSLQMLSSRLGTHF